LQQEPELDPTKTVFENVMEGIKESTSLLERFDKVSAEMGAPDADFDTLLEEQASLQDKIDHLNCWGTHHNHDDLSSSSSSLSSFMHAYSV
jgi:sulfate-transporting ATPase